MSVEVTRTGAEFLVNTATAGSQSDPAVTALAGGGFVVTWTDESLSLGDASATSIKAQLFDVAGARVGSEFLVNSQILGGQQASTVTAWALPFEALYQDSLRMITEGTSGITGFLLQLGPFGGAYVHGWGIRVWSVAYLAGILALGLFAFSRRNL